MAIPKKQIDLDSPVEQVRLALERLKAEYPDARVAVRRYTPYFIRVRVLASSFEGISRTARDNKAWKCLEQVPEDTVQQITLLALLTPEEAEHSLVSAEFDQPSESRL